MLDQDPGRLNDSFLWLKKRYWASLGLIRSAIRNLQCLVSQVTVLLRFFGAYSWFSIRGHHARHAVRRGPAAPYRLLVISYFSPPYQSRFGTQRLTKFLKYLSREDWKITVITTRPNLEEWTERQSEPFPPAVLEVRTEALQPSILWRNPPLVPDNYLGWIGPALETASKEIAREAPDVILATVPPYSNGIAAALLAVRHRIPLVVDFRDPWSKIETGWRLTGGFARWLTRRLEHGVLRIADKVVMASEAKYVGEFLSLPEKDIDGKVVSILNGYDEEDFEKQDGSPRFNGTPRFKLSYVGTFYDEETFLGIMMLMKAWERRYPAELADVEFHYAGQNSAFFDRCKFRPGYLIDHGYVCHEEAVALRCQSQVQLFCQPPHFKPDVSSGKIYEMIRTGAPIVAITNTTGAVATIVAATRSGVVVDNRKPEDGVAALRQYYLAWKENRAVEPQDWVAVQVYSRKAQADQLSAVLRSMIPGV